jgi:hypothetical protein
MGGGRGLSGNAPFTTTHVLVDDSGDLTNALAIDGRRRIRELFDQLPLLLRREDPLRSVAHPASKLAAIARTTARSFELVTLHLHSSPHVLGALGIAARLTGAEENRGDGSRGGGRS